MKHFGIKITKLFLFFFIFLFNINLYADEKISISKEYLIAHAGGSIDDTIYTNSYEAIINSINKGYKYIEIDFRISKDNVIIGLHSWSDINKFFKNNVDKDIIEKYKKLILNNNFTHDDITELNKYLKYKIIDQYLIEDIFVNNDDLILITDKIQDFKELESAFSFKDRIITEIHGIINYIYSLYYDIGTRLFLTDLSIHHKIFIYFMNIDYVVVNKELLNNNKKYKVLQQYLIQGKKIFIYTSNNPVLIQNEIGNTATLFYTDFL